jgi:hypothetical protein
MEHLLDHKKCSPLFQSKTVDGMLSARRDARAILKVELLNDVRLAPVQHDSHRCLVCGGVDQPGQVLVPVLTARPDTALWLHLEPCHEEHRRRRSTMVDELLHSALASTVTPTPLGPSAPSAYAVVRRPLILQFQTVNSR